jgi:hypothetical protein
MTAAIFGLLGVIVGGCITYAADIAMQRRNERARARVGAYLLHQELTTLKALLGFAANLGPTSAQLNTSRLFDVWEQYRADLTNVADWELLITPIASLSVQDHFPGEHTIDATQADRLLDQVEPALAVLDAAKDTSPPAERWGWRIVISVAPRR